MLAEIFLLRLELMMRVAAANLAVTRSRFVPYVAPRIDLAPARA